MPDETRSWMKKKYSIQLIIRSNTGSELIVHFSNAPFSATPDEALQVMSDFKAKIMSICVSSHDRLTPLVCFGRRLGEWFHKSVEHAVEDEVLIPVEVLRTSLLRITLMDLGPTEKT